MYHTLKSGYFILLITSFLVSNVECNMISNLIEQFKGWKEYFSFSENPNTLENDAATCKTEDGPCLLPENGRDDNGAFRKMPTDEDMNSLAPTKVILEENTYNDDIIDQFNNINTPEEMDTAENVETKHTKQFQVNEISSQNLKLSTIGNDLDNNDVVEVKKKEAEIFQKDLFDDVLLDENEIIIYDDMVKIELNEHKSNAPNEALKSDKDNQNPGENNNYILDSNKLDNDVNIRDTFLEKSEQNNLGIPASDQHIHVPDSLSKPENNLFSEAPIGDDDVLNRQSTLLKCSDSQDLLSSCAMKDTSYMVENINVMVESEDNFVNVEVDESNSKGCSTCGEKVFSSNNEESDNFLILDKTHETDSPSNSHIEEFITQDENEKYLVENVNDKESDKTAENVIIIDDIES